MKALLIAEKPSLMREIQNVYERNKATIPLEIHFLAQAGHLVGLKLPEEIDKKYKFWRMTNFPIAVPYEYKVLPGKNDLIKSIRDAVHSGEYDCVIHAGDPDGEGELLVRLVLAYVGNTLPVKRFWTNDLTSGAILGALQNLKDDAEYDPVYNAALVRQHTDYQFGMNVTGVATLKLGDLYKLGRVKAPIIKMIVDREHAVTEFVESFTWKPAFSYDGCEFVCEKVYTKLEEARLQRPATDYAVVTETKDETKNHKAPKLFKLSTLQTEAHRRHGISPARTLSTLQKLYEARFVSYPRTDCEYVSGGIHFQAIRDNAAAYCNVDASLLSRTIGAVRADHMYVNDAAIAQEGHTAIIPTNIAPANLDATEEKIYQLVARRFLAIFGEMKQVRNVSATAMPDGNPDNGEYVWKESSDVKAGFELIIDPAYKLKAGSGKTFQNGQKLQPIELFEKEIAAKPPARYNEGSLIAALDKPEEFKDDEGKVAYKIGTPATRAGIIEECIKCDYFTKDRKGIYYPTKKAEYVVEQIGDISLFQVVNSGRLESMLEQIRHGKDDPAMVEKALLDECHSVVEDIRGRAAAPKEPEILGKCPACGGEVTTGKYGAYCKNKCGMVVARAMGKQLTDSQVQDLLAGKRTLVRGLKSKTGKSYDAYLTPEGIESAWYEDKSGTRVEKKFYKLTIDFGKKTASAKASAGKTAKSAATKKTAAKTTSRKTTAAKKTSEETTAKKTGTGRRKKAEATS